MPDASSIPELNPRTRVSDADLLERIRDGDAASLDVLVDRHWEALVAYAASLLGGWDAAEDAAQEAFVRIWERRGSWVATGSVQALLYRIVRNVALDARKRCEREEARALRVASALPGVPTPLEEAASGQLEAAFHAALLTLSPRRREVYELVRFEGLSYAEVGEVLQLAPQTVANHLSAAVSQLRAQLAPHLGRPESVAAPDPTRAHQGN